MKDWYPEISSSGAWIGKFWSAGYSRYQPAHIFITRCIEKGIDVKMIAQWHGHQDGGRLILGTYSHVRNVHAEEMAKKLV